MRAIGTLFAVATIIAPAPAQAVGEESTLTLWVRGYPITRGGAVSGCSLEYNATGRDFIYKEGAQFGVTGNLTLNRVEKDGKPVVFASLKVILNDVASGRPVPSTPVDIHVVAANGSIMNERAAAAFDSDTAGGRVQPFQVSQGFTEVLGGIMEEQTFTVAFNRRSGGTDVRVPIDLTVKDVNLDTGKVTQSDEMVRTFSGCVTKLIADLA